MLTAVPALDSVCTVKVVDRTVKVVDRTVKVVDRTVKVVDRTVKVVDRTVPLTPTPTLCLHCEGCGPHCGGF